MKTVDILELIHQGNTTKQGTSEKVKGKLNDYRFYGFIQCEIPTELLPNYIKRLNKLDVRDKWVCMQIIAVGSIQELKKDKENTAFAYGNIAILVQGSLPLGDWYQVDGVARTVLYDGTGDCCYISNMTKKYNNWCVTPFPVVDLDLTTVSDDIENYIIKSAESGVIIKPEKPQGYELVRATDLMSELKLNTVKVTTPESLGVVILEKKNTVQSEISSKDDGIDMSYFDIEEEEEYIEVEAPKNNNKELLTKQDNNTRKPSESIDWNAVTVKRRPKFTVVNRIEKAPKTKKYDTLNKIVTESVLTREDTLSSLLEDYGIDNETVYDDDVTAFKNLLTSIKINSARKPKGVGLSGNAIIKELILKNEESSKDFEGDTLGNVLISCGTETICDYMLSKTGISDIQVSLGIYMSKEIKASVDAILSPSLQVNYACIYAILVGAKIADFRKTAETCEKIGISFIKIVKYNPYILILANSDLKFLTLEQLANARGIHSVEQDWRLACMLHEILLSDNGSTAFDISHLIKTKLSYSIGKLGLRRLSTENSLITEEAKANLVYYIDQSLSQAIWNYQNSDFDEWGKRVLAREELRKAIVAYVDAGLGTVHKGTLYNTQMLNKDIFIFNKVYELAYKKDNIKKDKIEKAIEDYENKKNEEFGFSTEQIMRGEGFKLEPLQADAMRLIDQNCACLTGPAGSGKTTTVEGMIFAIQQQNPKKKISIQFAAPTGKAAKRLQEVVGGNVKTMHSLFGVFGNNDSELIDFTDEDDNRSAQADIYIFDEQAMVDTNLMYKVLKGIKKTAQVFFLGDKEQLVAIGDGKPFADFLRFLPTVALSVTKRSAEGSAITRNAKNIIYNSEPNNYMELTEDGDFRIIPKLDRDIPYVIEDLCAYHLGKKTDIGYNTVTNLGVINPDDIQVISPVTKDRYVWGCDKLNVMLQDLFNPAVYAKNSSITYGFENNLTTLRVGSRVIHTANRYNYRHYSAISNGKFYMENKSAVMNGDVGYIVGIFDGDRCSEVEPDGGAIAKINNYDIIDMKNYYKKGHVIIAVKYYDADEKRDYFILYHGNKVENSSTFQDVVVSYTDLTDLQLAYCLTVHKMQGSQAKLVLFVLGTGMMSTFVNRNMLYTAITRASKACYLVGNINAMENGRKFESSSARHTALEELCIED